MDKEIQRFPWFDTIPLDDTIWKYKRAIEGHKFVLVDVEFIVENRETEIAQHGQIYDGHVYSIWGSFPNIFDQSALRMANLNKYNLQACFSLNNWECKEFTLSWHNEVTEGNTSRALILVYFYEVPMTKAERFEYAVKQPRYKYRHGSAITLDRYEE